MFSIVARGSSLLLIRTPERLMGLGQGNAVLHCEVNSTDELVRLLLNMGPLYSGVGGRRRRHCVCRGVYVVLGC